MEQDQDATIVGQVQEDADRTRAFAPPGLDATQMGASVQCPVCMARNISADVYCCECGFLLSSQPAEDAAPPQGPPAVLRDTRTGRVFQLEQGVLTVGRESSDILLSDASVSRSHAEIEFRGSDAIVSDCGSTNGTVVNGNRLAADEKQTLADGQEVRFGNCILVLEITRANETAQDAPPDDGGGEVTGLRESESPAPDAPQDAAPEVQDAPPPAAAADEPAPRPSGPCLWEKDNPAAVHPISPDGATIGRRTGQDIVLTNAYVSSAHAQIAVQDGDYVLTDVGSTNGTRVNGEILPPNQPRVLADGDVVTFGPVSVVFAKGEASEL